MTCEDVELRLLEPKPGEEVDAHVATCSSCQAFVRDLGLVIDRAALPAPTTAERAVLTGLAASTWNEWRRTQRRRQTWVGYAAAACFGALIASAGFWAVRPVRDASVEHVVEPVSPTRLAANEELDEPNFLADDVFFEVTWPETLEGETP
jgi:predicted anti-sigma-YlaC factor YlaD